MITSEPAVVVPLETDVEDGYDDDMTSVQGGASVSMYSHTHGEYGGAASVLGGGGSVNGKASNSLYSSYQPQQQPGRMMRRTSRTIGNVPSPPAAMIPIIQELKERNAQGLHTPTLSTSQNGSGSRRVLLPSSPQQMLLNLGSPVPTGKKIHRRSASFDQQFRQFNISSPQHKYLEASPTRQKKLFQVKQHSQTTVPNLH
jgi:hypothetical protein